MIVLKCNIELNNTEQAAAIKEGAVTIAKQLFPDNSKQFKELLALKSPSSQIGSYPPKN